MNSGGDDDRQQERTIPRFVVVALGDARCPATRASLVDVSEVNGVADEPVEVGGSRSAVQVGGAGPAGSDGAWLRSAPIVGRLAAPVVSRRLLHCRPPYRRGCLRQSVPGPPSPDASRGRPGWPQAALGRR